MLAVRSRALVACGFFLVWAGWSCSPQRLPVDPSRGVDAPVVAGFERFHRARGADPVAGGLLLLGELGCTACHEAPPSARDRITTRRAPRLARVAERVHHDHLRTLIASPHAAKRGSTMPDLWRGVEPSVRDAEVEAIVHYLVSLRPDGFSLAAPDHAAADRGARLYAEVGCSACHAPPGVNVPDAVPLAEMSNHYSLGALRRFLREPTTVRPSARMPSLGLTDREALDLAHYLLRETRVPGHLRYVLYYHGLDSLDDADDRTPVASGIADGFDPKIARRRTNFVLRFDGFVEITKAGVYEFHVTSDDGSRMWVGGKEVLDNDGVRRNNRARTASGRIELDTGWHEIAVEYFQRGKQAVLEVEWEGPGIARSPIPSAVLRHSREPIAAYVPLKPDPEQVARGRTAFVDRGCVQCHDDVDGGRATTFEPLVHLFPGRGCLARNPKAAVPDYRLDAWQKQALVAALTAVRRQLPEATAASRVVAAMQTFNCYACHERDGRGGVTDARDEFFVSSGIDLGEQGRIPPRLTGAGDRLQPSWLRRVIGEGAGVRPYMTTRMPRFPELAEQLARDFIELDRKVLEIPAPVDSDDDLVAAGHVLVGSKGMNCISCHNFNKRKAMTMEVIDLVVTRERVNEDWFHRYMRSPEQFTPQTRMPAFWTESGSSVKAVLDGDTTRQIQALWRYLADGERAVDPVGISRDSVELIVGGEAIVYRGKIWEAGWRGICVGYPERVNLGFDAEQMRLALLWKGRFLDVSAHWRRQGMGRIRPQGTDVRVFPQGPPFAALGDPDAPWPKEIGAAAGFRFRGYDIGELGRPTFRYEYLGVSVRDTPRAIEVGQRASLERILELESESEVPGISMRLGTGKSIENRGNGEFGVDGQLVIVIHGEARVRVAGGFQELVTPLEIPAGKTRVRIEYRWE